MQRLDYPLLHQDALPTQNHRRNRVVTISFTLATGNTKRCNCDTLRSFCKHLFDGDTCHIFYHFQASRKPFAGQRLVRALYCEPAEKINIDYYFRF